MSDGTSRSVAQHAHAQTVSAHWPSTGIGTFSSEEQVQLSLPSLASHWAMAVYCTLHFVMALTVASAFIHAACLAVSSKASTWLRRTHCRAGLLQGQSCARTTRPTSTCADSARASESSTCGSSRHTARKRFHRCPIACLHCPASQRASRLWQLPSHRRKRFHRCPIACLHCPAYHRRCCTSAGTPAI